MPRKIEQERTCRSTYTRLRAATAIAAVVAAAVPATAMAAPDWQFEATPYLWAAGMKGDVGVGRISAEGVETTFPDLMKSLRLGFMGSLEGRKGDWGFYADMIYMQLDQNHPASNRLLGDVQARPTQQGYALAGMWRAGKGDTAVDLFAGARLNDVKADLSVSSSALAPQGRRLVKSRSWVDGFVGVRVEAPVAERWRLMAYGDIGAGGSDSTWQVMAGARYVISPASSATFGYRLLKVDYHRDDFLYDMASGGPYAGYALRF